MHTHVDEQDKLVVVYNAGSAVWQRSALNALDVGSTSSIDCAPNCTFRLQLTRWTAACKLIPDGLLQKLTNTRNEYLKTYQ